MGTLIEEAALADWMAGIPGWEQEDDSIHRSFEFESYMDGIQFVNRIAEIAETANHHPDLEVSYGLVDVTLTTHDLKGLTEMDFAVAEKINALS